MRIAVVGVQGDVEEHVIATKRAMKKLNIEGEVIPTRKHGVVSKSDAVIIPGGESTTISKLIFSDSIASEILELVNSGNPVLGTCAGMVLLSKHGDKQVERTKTKLLGVMDTWVKRNAFGRQRQSFQVKLNVKPIGDVEAVFIRAPVVTKIGEKVQIMATLGEYIVAVKQDNVLALSFHPELTDDTRIHEYFLSLV